MLVLVSTKPIPQVTVGGKSLEVVLERVSTPEECVSLNIVGIAHEEPADTVKLVAWVKRRLQSRLGLWVDFHPKTNL